MKLGLSLVVCLFAVNAFGAEVKEKPFAPLLSGLGDHHHTINTTSKLAQRYFDQGLILTFNFNHREAIRSFTAAARHDPSCAMAYWGIAYAYGPHVNKPMTADEAEAAWDALQKARELQKTANLKESAYINALAARYEKNPKQDRAHLDKAYAAAMRRVTTEFPYDLDAQVLFAEASMNTMPWDYWTKDFTPRPETEEVITTLKSVLRRNPNHPGANHLYIHAIEAGPAPELGIPSADRLAKFAPAAGHLVHMPSHIYMRVGEYEKAAQSNRDSIRADQTYIRNCRAQGFYPGVYYPHNIHFLWWAETFQGRGSAALAAARKAADYANDNYCGPNKVEEAPRLRHLPGLTLVRFGRWDEALKSKVPPATNDFILDRVMWHYTLGLSFLGKKHTTYAEEELSNIKQLAKSDYANQLEKTFAPSRAMLLIVEHHLAAKIAAARNDFNNAWTHFEKAIEAEDSMPYMEPTYWPIPIRPSYGAALMKAGELAKAETIFRQDLAKWPRNPWSLHGLQQTLYRDNKPDAAAFVEREFTEAWGQADSAISLEWF